MSNKIIKKAAACGLSRGQRFDPAILHQSRAKRTQNHHSNGRQCVRFVLRDSQCHSDMKKAPTLPSSAAWALFCLNLPKIGKNSRNMKFSAKMQTSRVHIG